MQAAALATESAPVVSKTYRPKWADDPELAARMIKRLGELPFFESFEAGRDLMVERHGIALEEANGVMVVLGLQRLAECLAKYEDANQELGAMAHDGEFQERYWVARVFDWIGRPLKENGDVDLSAESGVHAKAEVAQ